MSEREASWALLRQRSAGDAARLLARGFQAGDGLQAQLFEFTFRECRGTQHFGRQRQRFGQLCTTCLHRNARALQVAADVGLGL